MNTRKVHIENVLILSCAISAGVHIALAPAHLEESTALGCGFALSAALLITVSLFLAAGGELEGAGARAAAVLLTGLMVAYGVSRTAGLPVGDEGVEPVDVTGVATQLVQATGVVAALALSRAARTGMVRALHEETSSR